MNIFYLKVELITLCSVLAYFYVALKHFNASGNYISKQLSFLAYSWILIFMAILYKLSLSKLHEFGFIEKIVTLIGISVAVYIFYRMQRILKDTKGSKSYIIMSTSIILITLLLFFIQRHEYQSVIGIVYFIFLTTLSGLIYLRVAIKYKPSDIGVLYLFFATILAFWSIVMLYTNGVNETLITLVFLVLKTILIGSVLIFFSKSQRILKDKVDDLNRQSKKLTQAEIKILRLAYVDPVTEIPNNVAFQKDFNDKEHLNDKRIVLLINLDNFKYVNNIIGFTRGNDYLKEVAKLIIETASSNDKVYSLGGDQFGVIHYGNELSASNLASKIIEAINKSQKLVVKHYKMGASIGISNISLDHDYNKSMKELELALLEVKDNGKNSYACYDSRIDDLYEKKLMMENKLELAIVKKQFQMYFQPQVDLKSCKIVGVEALIRWIDDEGNFISPEEFIPLAEKTGKMNRISEFIIDESLKKLRSIIDSGYDDIKMSINVSAVEIYEEGFVSGFMKNINKYSLNPSKVNLEITETSLIENIDVASSIFKELRSYDITISLDDFGVGYSSLNYFSKLPVSEVKFDKNFTNDLLYSKKNEVILKHFTELSHTLGIDVVIEGIENADQLSIIDKLGCDKYQGYLYSKPLPFNKLIELLEKNSNIQVFEGMEIS